MTAKQAVRSWLARRHQQGHRHDLVLAFYGFLTGCAITGGFITAIALDRARIWANTQKLKKAAKR